nr:hypothetical protein [Entomoplasma sp. MP1]
MIKNLQKEYNFSVIFITHDLGVVANIADRVAVMYAGQIIEIGTTEEIFKDAKHPYTSRYYHFHNLVLKEKDYILFQELHQIYLMKLKVMHLHHEENKYALAIDYIYEPPMFKVTETHYAKLDYCMNIQIKILNQKGE